MNRPRGENRLLSNYQREKSRGWYFEEQLWLLDTGLFTLRIIATYYIKN